MLSLRYRGFWLATSVALVGLVVLGSLLPSGSVVPPTEFDKLLHLGTYVVLAVWFTGIVPRIRYGWVVAGLLGLGLALELLQQWMNLGRIGDPLDLTANAGGVGAGIALALAGAGGWAGRVESWFSRS